MPKFVIVSVDSQGSVRHELDAENPTGVGEGTVFKHRHDANKFRNNLEVEHLDRNFYTLTIPED